MARRPLVEQAYCSVRDACVRIGVDERTLRYWIDKGAVRSIRIGGRRLVDIESL